jgi:multidrug efflux system membrane fusion protein
MKSFPDTDTGTLAPSPTPGVPGSPGRPEPIVPAGSPVPAGPAVPNASAAAAAPGASTVHAAPAIPTGPTSAAQHPRRPLDQAPAGPGTRRRTLPLLLVLLVLLLAAGGWYYWQYWRPAQAAKTAAATAPAAGRAEGGAAAPGGAAGAPGARAPGGRAGPEAQRTPVVAVAAQAGDMPIVIDALGTVAPTQTVSVKSRVAGLLERVLFKEGDLVKEGQLLAEIDPRGLKVQLAQSQGQLARDRALLENARVDLKRYETLFKQDSIARQQVDTQRALVRQYEGLIQVDESQVDSARLQLGYARVLAPISGRAGLRQVDAGNMVTGTEVNGLVVITQVEPISVVFAVPQDDLPKIIRRISSGDKLPVKAYDRTQQNLLATGVLVSLDNLIDATTGTIKLKAEFPNKDGQLFPNQFVNARLELDTLRDVVTVPSSAIQRGSQGMFVYTVKPDQTVALRPVTLGPADGQRVVLATGVAAGERVVVDGVDRLREGAAVELIERPDFQAPPPPRPSSTPGAQGQRRRPAGGPPR